MKNKRGGTFLDEKFLVDVLFTTIFVANLSTTV